MRKLNTAQLKFCDLVIEGYTDVEAFKQCWRWEKLNANNLRVEANRRRKHPGIKAEIERRQEEIAENAQVTAESLILELEQARMTALVSNQPGAMVAATMGKAKLTGLDKVIVELEIPEATEIKITRTVVDVGEST